MKSMHDLRNVATYVINFLEDMPPEQGETASGLILDLLSMVGASVCESGELDRVGVLALWSQAMLDADPEIQISAVPSMGGYVLTARRYLRIRWCNVSATILWSSTMDYTALAELCAKYAAELMVDSQVSA